MTYLTNTKELECDVFAEDIFVRKELLLERLINDGHPGSLQIVVHRELAANDAVCLGVAAAPEPSRLPQQTHLLVEAGDDRVNPGVGVLRRALLRERQMLVPTAHVDQGGDQTFAEVAKERIERWPHERIEPPLEVQQRRGGIGDPVEKW